MTMLKGVVSNSKNADADYKNNIRGLPSYQTKEPAPYTPTRDERKREARKRDIRALWVFVIIPFIVFLITWVFKALPSQ
ncbi:MAG TPA: hypothetical protein PLN21_11660 [Gemmatales bacterium]|nr:hypothetical protein [Gemmatales bacterium]